MFYMTGNMFRLQNTHNASQESLNANTCLIDLYNLYSVQQCSGKLTLQKQGNVLKLLFVQIYFYPLCVVRNANEMHHNR